MIKTRYVGHSKTFTQTLNYNIAGDTKKQGVYINFRKKRPTDNSELCSGGTDSGGKLLIARAIDRTPTGVLYKNYIYDLRCSTYNSIIGNVVIITF